MKYFTVKITRQKQKESRILWDWIITKCVVFKSMFMWMANVLR